MKTKMFNVLSLIANIVATLTCIASIALMAAEEKLNIFLTATFYLTILTFFVSFIGMQYNVRSYNLNKPITPKWYVIVRLATISALVMNALLAFAFTENAAWAIPYFLTRLALPLLLAICFIFFDVDSKVPFAAVVAAPAFFCLYYAVFLPMFGLGIINPPYEFLNVADNAWTVTLLLVIGTIACSILVAATLRALNFSIHYAAYGKFEQEERIKKLAMEKQKEEVELKDLEAPVSEDENEEAEEVTEVITEPEVKPVEEEPVKVETSTDKIKKVSEPTEPIKDSVTTTKTIKKVNTNTSKIKKVDTGTIKKVTDTKTIKKVKPETNTKTIKKVEPSNSIAEKAEDFDRPVKKIDTKTGSINKIDTSTKFINKLGEEINRVYHVSHHKTLNKWQVKLAGSTRALKLFKTQLDAINYAKELTKTRGGSIRIHSVNGTIRKG